MCCVFACTGKRILSTEITDTMVKTKLYTQRKNILYVLDGTFKNVLFVAGKVNLQNIFIVFKGYLDSKDCCCKGKCVQFMPW